MINEVITGVLLAIGALITAYVTLIKVRDEAHEGQTKSWIALDEKWQQRVVVLENENKENRVRIKELEAAELVSKKLAIDSQSRIAELERMNADGATRIESLEADHMRVVEILKTYQRGVAILVNQLRGLKVEPEWTPDTPK